MKFSWFGLRCCGGLAVVLLAAALQAQDAAQPANQHGQVVMGRSVDENGAVHNQGLAAQGEPAAVAQSARSQVTDGERQAAHIVAYTIDLRMRTATGQMAARAQLTVRNEGSQPLHEIPLQISSSLNWDRILMGGKAAKVAVTRLNSDVDHTGQLNEAAVALDQPLNPGQSLQLDASYSGSIVLDTHRLAAIGTPEKVARHSDWDRIGTDFTGIRGLGNVVWYPAVSAPVLLGDGARLFDVMGEHKRRMAGVRFRMRVTAEFPHGQPPTVALINGHAVELKVTESGMLDQQQEVAGTAVAELPVTTLGFEAPSVFLAIRTAHTGANMTAWSLDEDVATVSEWTAAAQAVTPFLQGWLGQKPRAELTLLDLPEAEDAPFETGALLATHLRSTAEEQLQGVMAHALTHAWMQSPRAWLSEGVAHFMGTLWTERMKGRTAALESLESGREALALIEPASPGVSAGQPLAEAINPVYYRTKAAYVLWMLRDVVGDPTLSAALRGYDPVADEGTVTAPSSFEKLVEGAGLRKDLHWFFGDWVDADRGLPDFVIDGAYPSTASAGNWLVAVNVSNNGYAQAEVPVTVHSAVASVTQRLLVPAHGKAVQRILVQGKPLLVQVNDGTIPEVTVSLHETKLEDAPAPVNQPQQKR